MRENKTNFLKTKPQIIDTTVRTVLLLGLPVFSLAHAFIVSKLLDAMHDYHLPSPGDAGQ